ncbi:MAG: hypothetical protein ACPGSC_05595 [Granulosicoccaceae bacterium]
MEQQALQKKRGMSVLGIVLITAFITIAGTIWLLNSELFADRFTPTELSGEEKIELQQKLKAVGLSDLDVGLNAEENMDPEPYTENPDNREISLSEREVNALLDKNSDMGEKLVLDFSDNLMSAKLLMPLDPDFPFFGGKTLRASTGVSVSVKNGVPSVVLKGVSVWGVPVPNAWLGGLKNVDLVNEFGDAGFWKSFSEGIEDVEVREGQLKLKLRE